MSSEGRRVFTVLRSGGDFGPQHVQILGWQLERWAPGVELVCLTDMDVPGIKTLPLLHKWPGWWSKLELFRPDIKGDFLMTDLDNVIVGPIDEFFDRGIYTSQQGGWNALAWVPEYVRAYVWEPFIRNPEGAMSRFAQPYGNGQPFGDAGFIATCVSGDWWEQALPGRVVNIVEMIRPTPLGPRWNGVPPNARVVLCARPDRRPWMLPMFRDLYEEKS